METPVYNRPIADSFGVKTVGELIKEGKVIYMVDNRIYNVSGLQASNQNINFGDHVTSNQTVYVSDHEISELLKSLTEEVYKNGDIKDQEILKEIDSNIKQKKWDTAKTLFGIFGKTIQVSAAGSTLAKVFGWI